MSDSATLDFAEIGRRLLHPTQRKILERLTELGEKGRVSPNQLSNDLGEALGNVSYHVKVLAGYEQGKFAGHPMIELVGTRPRRGAVEHFYALIA